MNIAYAFFLLGFGALLYDYNELGEVTFWSRLLLQVAPLFAALCMIGVSDGVVLDEAAFPEWEDEE